MSAETAAAAPQPGSYGEIQALMKKMGCKKFWDPIPPDQHAWAMAKDQPPLLRVWGAMCHFTIHAGHRKEYAVNKEGQAISIEQLAEFLEMDEGNARKSWREGVERGLWRNGAKEEGKRKLYLCGHVPPFKIGLATQKNDCTDLFESFPPYQREAIKALSEDKQKEFLSRATAVSARGKAVLAELMAAGREVIDKEYDTLFREFAIPKIREVHAKKALAPEEVEALKARQARVARLVPVVEQFVLTFEQSEQTVETASYSEQDAGVQTAPTLLPLETIEKGLESARISSNGTPSSEQTLPTNQRSSVNQQYAPPTAAMRNREARSQIQKQARENRAKAEPETSTQTPEPKTPDPDAAMVDELFHQLDRMQTAYPHTDFSADPVNASDPGDRATVKQIVRAVDNDVIGFCVYVAAKFKGLDRNALGKLPARSPEHPTGPRSLGLILEWAHDYARGHRLPTPAQRAAEETKRRYESDVQTRNRAQRTLDDPGAPEEKKKLARVILGLETAKGAGDD